MRIPIITYHAIGEGPPPLWISETEFRSHIAALAAAGFRSISVADAARALAAGTLPEKAVAITFDDAYGSVLSALPILREHQFIATLYVVTDFAGQDNGWPGQPSRVPRTALLSWESIGALAAEGWEIGSHGRTHTPLVRLDEAAIENEMTSSNEEIARRTGAGVETLAFPYGDTDARVRRLAGRHYQAAVGTRLGYAAERSDRFELPRIDAYYLRRRLAERIDGSAAAAYFFVRQVIRSARAMIEARPT